MSRACNFFDDEDRTISYAKELFVVAHPEGWKWEWTSDQVKEQYIRIADHLLKDKPSDQ